MSKKTYDAIIGLLEKRGPVPEGIEQERHELGTTLTDLIRMAQNPDCCKNNIKY